MASGGDDNMLAVSRFEVTDSDKFCIHSKSKCLLDSVHSAQITGNLLHLYLVIRVLHHFQQHLVSGQALGEYHT